MRAAAELKETEKIDTKRFRSKIEEQRHWMRDITCKDLIELLTESEIGALDYVYHLCRGYYLS